jgi:hypothetical protein
MSGNFTSRSQAAIIRSFSARVNRILYFLLIIVFTSAITILRCGTLGARLFQKSVVARVFETRGKP